MTDSTHPTSQRPDPADREPAGSDDAYERALSAPGRVGGDAGAAELSDEQVALLNSLFDLARAGDPTLLAYLDQGIPADLADHKGDTFLILATYAGQAEMARKLIAAGADVNALNQRGQSALTCAVFRGDADLVQDLVAAGADPTLGAQNAVDTAKAFDQPQLLELLRG